MVEWEEVYWRMEFSYYLTLDFGHSTARCHAAFRRIIRSLNRDRWAWAAHATFPDPDNNDKKEKNDDGRWIAASHVKKWFVHRVYVSDKLRSWTWTDRAKLRGVMIHEADHQAGIKHPNAYNPDDLTCTAIPE